MCKTWMLHCFELHKKENKGPKESKSTLFLTDVAIMKYP